MKTLQTRKKRLGVKLIAAYIFVTLIPIVAIGIYLYSSSDELRYSLNWNIFMIIGAGSLVISALVAAWSSASIMRPLNHIISTIYFIISGNQHTRIELNSHDEMEQLGNAVNELMEERVKAIRNISKENDLLNDSVIKLMEATSELSNKDLTIKVPVQEDVTGAIADAMNQMVHETARVLRQIKQVAYDVQDAANMVKVQGDKVSSVAASERTTIEHTRQKLHDSAKTMSDVVATAKASKDVANRATESTEQALETVIRSIDGMQEIRGIISETEKRIKRLGERSQEITSVVEIINNIAERTNVLALNASMQAAAAGEAGRSFAVVADEVQRLAESSRNSTSQIATLVRNIQTETSETMATMNRTIDQVIAGSDLAEQAGKQMQDTKITTAELASMVEKIVEQAEVQAQIANRLLGNANEIQESTQRTGEELQEQTAHTDNLILFSRTLLESVEVFKLPGDSTRSAG